MKILKCKLSNQVLTSMKSGYVYQVGTYCERAVCGYGAGRYYLGKFELHDYPKGYVWCMGRFRGERKGTPICIGKLEDMAEVLEIPQSFAEELQHAGGTGRKARFVSCAGGCIWLEDYFRFRDPFHILECAMEREDKKIGIHTELPIPAYWPKWKVEEDSRLKVVG